MQPQWLTDHYNRWNAANNLAKELGFPEKAGTLKWANEFAKAIGYCDWTSVRAAQNRQDKELEHRLELLMGPHALTIWKAIQARELK